jgi:hypothetical protein
MPLLARNVSEVAREDRSGVVTSLEAVAAAAYVPASPAFARGSRVGGPVAPSIRVPDGAPPVWRARHARRPRDERFVDLSLRHVGCSRGHAKFSTHRRDARASAVRCAAGAGGGALRARIRRAGRRRVGRASEVRVAGAHGPRPVRAGNAAGGTRRGSRSDNRGDGISELRRARARGARGRRRRMGRRTGNVAGSRSFRRRASRERARGAPKILPATPANDGA